MKNAIVIGGGIAGCTAAYLLNKKGFNVDIIEMGSFLGGGNKTSWFGGHPFTFGPRHLITKNETVYEFLHNIMPLKNLDGYSLLNFQHEEKRFFHYPVNENEIKYFEKKDLIVNELQLIKESDFDYSKIVNFEEYWRHSIGDTLYEKFVGNYSKKMWRLDDNKLIDDFGWSPKGAPLRSGNFEVYPKKDGWFCCYPDDINGYDFYFKYLTNDVNCYLNTKIDEFDTINKRFYFNGKWNKYDVVINTISPDLLFDNEFGKLAFVGRDIELIILPVKNLFPKDVYMLYYPGPEKYTRIVEYKQFTGFDSTNTLIGVEYPSENGRHYPLPIKSEHNRAKKYLDMLPSGAFSIGRAGSYNYVIDIDDAIQQAIDLLEFI